MKNKESIKEAERLMQPGYFHRAVSIYESLGMKEKAKEASLKCAVDCMKNYRPAFAMKYLEKAGKGDIAKQVENICSIHGFSPSEDLEMRACGMMLCPDYVDKAMAVSQSKDMNSLIEKLS